MTLKLWDASTGMELRTFKGHTGKVTAIALVAGRPHRGFRQRGQQPETLGHLHRQRTAHIRERDRRNNLRGLLAQRPHHPLRPVRWTCNREAGNRQPRAASSLIVQGPGTIPVALGRRHRPQAARIREAKGGVGVSVVAFSPTAVLPPRETFRTCISGIPQRGNCCPSLPMSMAARALCLLAFTAGGRRRPYRRLQLAQDLGHRRQESAAHLRGVSWDDSLPIPCPGGPAIRRQLRGGAAPEGGRKEGLAQGHAGDFAPGPLCWRFAGRAGRCSPAAATAC